MLKNSNSRNMKYIIINLLPVGWIEIIRWTIHAELKFLLVTIICNSEFISIETLMKNTYIDF